jgi:hypothetical protein
MHLGLAIWGRSSKQPGFCALTSHVRVARKSIFATVLEPAASRGCYQRMELVTFGKYATHLFIESDCQ